MSQIVRRETLLPLNEATLLEEGEASAGGMRGGEADGGQERMSQEEAQIGGGQASAEPPGRRIYVEYEPDPEAVLKRLVPDYVKLSIFRALLESTASEHGARMTAMRNASQNAGELIKDLTLEMNRARQAEITQEIMEVVAGAEGLG